MKMAR